MVPQDQRQVSSDSSKPATEEARPDSRAFWSRGSPQVLESLQSTPEGLSGAEAARRLGSYGPNLLKPRPSTAAIGLFLAQFKSPIILILIGAALLSIFLGDTSNSLIILTIVFVSAGLGFWQEKGASDAVARLLATVKIRARVIRDGVVAEVPTELVVPGDVVLVSAGDMIPGDGLIVESNDLFVDEATLTGETYPVEKASGVVPAGAPASQRTNALFMGTHVSSGSARMVVVRTGRQTEFGAVSERLKDTPPETEFERGVRRFGYLLLEITLLLVIAIFAINVFLDRPVLDSFLFSLALAVGLTPQLLPAIIGINLAHGARQMASKKVIVKRLASIENFGSMNVLCSDKTGTLTSGVVKLNAALGIDGQENQRVLLYAYLNSSYESGFSNPTDVAIRNYRSFDIGGYRKTDEVPYDFIRKRLSVLVETQTEALMITKGALGTVLDVCSRAETSGGQLVEIRSAADQIEADFEQLSAQGYRVLGLAYRTWPLKTVIDKDSEKDMTFLGFLTFYDPPKPNVAETVKRLRELGIALKMITGDNRLVAANIARQVGLSSESVITGPELHRIGDEALLGRIAEVDVFAEVEPNQKERILMAFRKANNVVGYLGDGINDASALHAADVGISVDGAADVAKEAAEIVLLEKDLAVLLDGVQAGRTTFANTLKYVFMATSANFGNMFSMAGASLFLSFLPLLPSQILLTNLLTDFPEMTIASDAVDREWVQAPRRWNIAFIRRFMVVFGILSSVFDYLTFGALLFLLHANIAQFRTGWFMESVVSASLIVLIIRTRRPFFRSRPGRYLFGATISIIVVTLLLPYTPLGTLLGFETLPVEFLGLLALIVLLYVVGAELAKKVFYRWARGM